MLLKKKSMIVIDKKLNIMDLKLKYIPFKERYETVDFWYLYYSSSGSDL